MLKRVLLAAAITVAAVKVWTGGPLLALWVGSRAQGSGPPTMTAVFVVVGALALISFTLVWLLGHLSRAYEQMTGEAPTVRQHAPWLRSMSGERPRYEGVPPTLTTPERILVGMVVVAIVAFEIWFFFFSASPIDERTGRSAAPVRPAAVSHAAADQLRKARASREPSGPESAAQLSPRSSPTRSGCRSAPRRRSWPIPSL